MLEMEIKILNHNFFLHNVFSKKATIDFSVSILFTIQISIRDFLPFFSDDFSMRSYNSMLTWHPRRDMTKRVERDQTNIIGVRFLLSGSNSFLNFVLNLIYLGSLSRVSEQNQLPSHFSFWGLICSRR